jgi:hypothetical protein
MKRFMLWALVGVSLIVLGSCVFPGTATVSVKNNSTHTITAVNFVAISGGVTDNNAVSIAPEDTEWFYRIEPGTYRIDMTASGVSGTTEFDPSFTVVEGTIYPRLVYDSDF